MLSTELCRIGGSLRGTRRKTLRHTSRTARLSLERRPVYKGAPHLVRGCWMDAARGGWAQGKSPAVSYISPQRNACTVLAQESISHRDSGLISFSFQLNETFLSSFCGDLHTSARRGELCLSPKHPIPPKYHPMGRQRRCCSRLRGGEAWWVSVPPHGQADLHSCRTSTSRPRPRRPWLMQSHSGPAGKAFVASVRAFYHMYM